MKTPKFIERALLHLKLEAAHRANDRRFAALSSRVVEAAPEKTAAPVIFFDVSTRLTGTSLNAAFAALSAWSLELKGVRVIHFVCQQGLAPCVFGTKRGALHQNPPCRGCMRQSEALFGQSEVVSFGFDAEALPRGLLEPLGLDQLSRFTYADLPLGELALPSMRWILRRHHLADNELTRSLFMKYIRSAYSLALQFEALIQETQPQTVVVFNGMQYPEATARWMARKHGIRVISHEVGIRPFSAYFTEGDATAYDLDIPADFQLNEAQNQRLDDYLSKRFKGDFHMAGVKFWPEMSELSPEFQRKAAKFKQMVPIFTNVIFDTSQPHANVVFEDMFTWLDSLLITARAHPETLFVIRAHPDEARVGKASEESVAEWAEARGLRKIPNLYFIPPKEYVNSYDLIRMAKFVLIYNSTIGLEASILGTAVLSAGKARFTASEVAWLPQTKAAYQAKLDSLLDAETVEAPPHFKHNARRFLYWQLYRSSLSFEDFLKPDGVWAGYVTLKEFPWQALLPENSVTLQTIHDGILHSGDFMLKEDPQ
jgi:hypothetical protein